METSARNQLRGKVEKLEETDLTALCEVIVTETSIVTAVIDRSALDLLSIKEGDEVSLLVSPNQIVVRAKK
ncbi:MAG: TOBE domain-containing protein [Candidatus Helarchaeota archaeon]